MIAQRCLPPRQIYGQTSAFQVTGNHARTARCGAVHWPFDKLGTRFTQKWARPGGKLGCGQFSGATPGEMHG
jgi:hypothetical protein